MPKTMSVLLREEFLRNGYELLDIYRFKDHDVIRFRHKLTGKIYIVESKRHVTELTGLEDVQELVRSLVEKAEGKKS